MKLKQKVLTYKILCGLLGLAVIIVGVNAVNAYSGSDKVSTVIENADTINITNEATEGEESFGANSGPRKYQRQDFLQGFTTGGDSLNASTTLTAARTITATEICNNSYIHVNSAAVAGTVAAASLDLTFAATSTLFSDCLNYNGATASFTFRNNSPTTASTTELVAGTGCDLRLPETTGADNDIEGLNEAEITIRRQDDAFADGGSVDCIITVKETVVD